jgi:ABC-type multidrug transport system ATPase subunit
MITSADHAQRQESAQDFRRARRGGQCDVCRRRRELLGLLGPNGAGKTTTVSMIAGAERGQRRVLVGGSRLVGDTDPVKAAHPDSCRRIWRCTKN